MPRPVPASRIIETERLPVEIPPPIEACDSLDDTFVQVVRVIHAVKLTVEGIAFPCRPETPPLAHEIRGHVGQHQIPGSPRARDVAESNYAAVLIRTVHCGKELLARDDLEDLKEDFAQLDGDMLREVHATIGYVSDYFGIDVTLPPLPPDSGADGTSDTHHDTTDSTSATHT